jgi:hypothetical protein
MRFNPYGTGARAQLGRILTSADFANAERASSFLRFVEMSYRPGESSIRVGSPDSTVFKVVLSADTSATYAPVFAGHALSLLFVSHRSLMAQPFDSGRLEVRGEPEMVVSEVRYRRWPVISDDTVSGTVAAPCQR